MRSFEARSVVLVAAVIIALLAGALYTLTLRSSRPLSQLVSSDGSPGTEGSLSASRAQLGDEYGVPNKDDLHVYSEAEVHGVHARGRLRLIAGLGELDYDQRWPALGELLEREKVAPIAPFYSRRYETNVPGSVIRRI